MLAHQLLDRADDTLLFLVNPPPPVFHFDQPQVASESESMILSGQASVAATTRIVCPQALETERVGRSWGPVILRRERLREVTWRNRRLELRREIEYSVVLDDGLYVVEYEPLRIIAYADSLHGAKRDFSEEFFVLWDSFGVASAEELAPSGVRLKQRLLELVTRETEADEA